MDLAWGQFTCILKAHPRGITWEELNVLRGLEGHPILHPGDVGGWEGQCLADQGNWIVDGHGHFLVGVVLRCSQDGGKHCEGEAGRPWLTELNPGPGDPEDRTARALGFSLVLELSDECGRRKLGAAKPSSTMEPHYRMR